MTTKDDYINYRLAKSQEVFEDARILAESERWNSCVNRLYYSVFYAVSALLYKNEIQAETHNGIKTQFNLHFIKTELIDRSCGKLYSNLFGWRQEIDYADFIDFDAETVEPLIKEVEQLMNVIRAEIE